MSAPSASGLTVVMAGGGTGGHIVPALAVANELRRRGHHPLFIGTKKGLEAKLVPAANFEIEWITIGGLNRVSFAQRLKSLIQLPLSTARVYFLFGRRKPSAVFSMGGYVAGPVMLAARLRGTPTILMEPNAIPGFVNRRMGRYVARALINFPETAEYFPPGRSELTGMPVRKEFFDLPSTRPASPFHILITGGSQGSRTLNRAARESWLLFRQAGLDIRITHQTGTPEYESISKDFAATGLNGEVMRFINDMPAAFGSAHLAICRSGASTVSELAAAGLPAILVPFPFAADNHQQVNAESFARAGGGRVVIDSEMNGQRLFEEVTRFMADRDELARMAVAAREFSKPRAAERSADILEELSRGGR